jgi:flagellin-specific chaperone FliS
MVATIQPSQKYRELQVLTATPLQRLLMVYDVAVMGCTQRDLKRTTEALNLLRNSLDLTQGEPAMGLFRLYQYCGELARAGDFDTAGTILRELVQAWVQVLVREMDARTKARQEYAGISMAG